MEPIQYKEIKEGLYLIDEEGNIYSNYKKGYLTPKKDKDGYLNIALSQGSGKNKCYVRIATLVAWTFIGPPPKTMLDPTINHKDGNILNNHYTNLEWMERGENASIRSNKGQGSTNPEAKLTEDQVIEICELLVNTNISYQELCEKYNIKKSTISNIKTQKNWKNITTRYDFSCRQNIRNNLGQFENINIKFYPQYQVGVK